MGRRNFLFQRFAIFSIGFCGGAIFTHCCYVFYKSTSILPLFLSHNAEKNPRKKRSQNIIEPTLFFDKAGLPLRLLRKAETVLTKRTGRLILVLERCTDSHNYTAVLRTAECLGVQHVWLVAPPVDSSGPISKVPDSKDVGRKAAAKLKRKKGLWKADQKELQEAMGYARRAQQWLTVRNFQTSQECLAALIEEKAEIWATDLSQEAIALNSTAPISIPEKLAVVMGTESSGVSEFMLANAHRRVYIPLRGFSDSLNLSVSAALMMQLFFFLCPEAEGDLCEGEASELRKDWYNKLARNQDQLAEFSTYIHNPPPPFDDLRRPNEHRIAFISKKERNRDINCTNR